MSYVSVRSFLLTVSLPLTRLHHARVVDVVQPTLPWPWLTTPLCLLVVVNLFAHYYLVCTVSPGFVDDSPNSQDSARGWVWAKKRDGSRRQLTGVQWSEELNMTKATTSKCKRCGVMRPEVRCMLTLASGRTCSVGCREHTIVEYANVAC